MVVVPLRRARGVIRHLKSPDEMDLEEVRTTTVTVHTDIRAWKEEKTYENTQTHIHTIPQLKTPGNAYPFFIQYQCLNISHRYWNVLFFSSVCLFSLCFPSVSISQLLKDISQRQRDSRQQKQVDLRRAYITARFTPATLPAFFTLGDQLDYGGFENRALEPGQEYVFFILAELNSTTGVRKPLCRISFLSVFITTPSFSRCMCFSPAGCHYTL